MASGRNRDFTTEKKEENAPLQGIGRHSLANAKIRAGIKSNIPPAKDVGSCAQPTLFVLCFIVASMKLRRLPGCLSKICAVNRAGKCHA
jgi:hypothetical protein